MRLIFGPLLHFDDIQSQAVHFTENNGKIKADRPHPRDYSAHRQVPWIVNDGRYQVHYLPRFAVYNQITLKFPLGITGYVIKLDRWFSLNTVTQPIFIVDHRNLLQCVSVHLCDISIFLPF